MQMVSGTRLGLSLMLTGLLASCGNRPGDPEKGAASQKIDGAAASRASCVSCHAYPEPGLLERGAWPAVLNRMKLFTGLAKPDVARMNNPELAANTNIFPSQPLISAEAWTAIESYYQAEAPEHQPALRRPLIPETLPLFAPVALGFTVPSPTTTFVSISAGERGVLFADAKTEMLSLVRNDGTLVWSADASNIVTCVRNIAESSFAVGIGDFFPSDDLLGELIVYDSQKPTSGLRRVLTGLPRVTHVEPGDFNGDGQMDFALSIFGNLLGRFSYFANDPGSYREKLLWDKPGAMKSIASDFNQDGRLDLAVLVAQATEALLIFTNLHEAKPAAAEVFRKPPTYGHTDFETADFNGDGQSDFLVVNGDNADFHTEPRPYHGLRIYAAEGKTYREAYFFPFFGAYRAVARDFDGDGDQDIAAISFFPDYGRTPEAFVYLENRGDFDFKPGTFKGANIGRWLCLDAGDVDGDGDIDLALGAVAEMPDMVAPEALRALWLKQSPSVLMLINQSH